MGGFTGHRNITEIMVKTALTSNHTIPTFNDVERKGFENTTGKGKNANIPEIFGS